MSKKLRKGKVIYIAPDIIGQLDDNYQPSVLDQRIVRILDPTNPMDKIDIYERQVKEWFLKPATTLVRQKNNGFIVLMICLSYLEGIEQYKKGVPSDRNSKRFFVESMQRLYPNKFENYQLEDLYSDARCGLFHNGMVKGAVIINNKFSESIRFSNGDIEISPSKFLKDIKEDFDNYITKLKEDEEARNLFAEMYSNV